MGDRPELPAPPKATCSRCKGSHIEPTPSWWRSKKFVPVRPCKECSS